MNKAQQINLLKCLNSLNCMDHKTNKMKVTYGNNNGRTEAHYTPNILS